MQLSIFNKIILLILIAFVPAFSSAQTVTTTKRKEIGNYKQLSFTRYIENGDTSFVISFPDLTYVHLIDLSFNTFSKEDLKDFANAIDALNKLKFVKGETNTVELRNGFLIKKFRAMGMWISIYAKDLKYTNLPMAQALRLRDDILATLSTESKN